MNKTKSKVLSLILASAMIVSSFSSLNFASAAKSSETGRLSVGDDELYLVSNTSDNDVTIDNLLQDVTLKTFDNETVGDAEFVSFTHASGDRIVKSIKDTDDDDNVVTLKNDAQGKEVITVTYEGDYDRDDKTVTVRAKKDITIYADPKGAQIIAENGNETYTDDKPGDVGSAAINDQTLKVGVYRVVDNGGLLAKYQKETDEYLNTLSPAGTSLSGTVKKESDKAFDIAKDATVTAVDGVITVNTKYRAAVAKNDNAANIATVKDATDAITEAKTQLTNITGETTKADVLKAVQDAAVATGDAADSLSDVDASGSTATSETKAAKTSVGTVDSTVTALETTVTSDANYSTATKYSDLETATQTAVSNALSAVNALLASPDGALVKAKTAEAAVVNAGVAEKMASTGTINLEFKLLTGDKDKPSDTEKTTIKLSVEKKWRAEQPTVEINKKGSTTYITRKAGGISSWESDDWKNVNKTTDVYSITGYDIAAYNATDVVNTINVTDGKVGNISGNGKTIVAMDDGNVGDIKAQTITIDDGSAGTLKQKGTDPTITVSDGKIKAIDADAAIVTVNGGTVSGDITGMTVDIDSNDEDVPTTISGNVEAKGDSDASVDPVVEIGSSSDAAVKVAGTVKGAVTLNDEFVTVGAIDADYENNVTFEDFKGKVDSIKNAYDVDVDVNGESNVTLKGALECSTLTIEDEDGKLTVDEGHFNSVSGDGTLAIPAGKLFIEDSMEDITLQLTTGLVAGATAFQAYSDAVDVEDFSTLGYTLEQKAVNSDTDKFVIKTVTFAGVQFDQTDLSIAKGQTGTLTVSAYPTGTALPAGASIDWSIDANDDYISVTTEGNVATVKVLDYNADYATDNQATITATVVDADGNTYDDFVSATAKVTGTALPTSTVTLDTTKPVTVGTGAVYQYIAKSSTGAVMSAASSDTQIATVELFNAADPRGYKFQVKGVAEGTATITTTDANGATATLAVTVAKVNGTLKADTTTYTFAPGKVYDVKFSTTGTTAVPVVTVNGKVVSIAPRGNGVYRVTAQNPGTAFVVATVGNTHVSVKFVVANGAAAVGVKGNNVSTLK